VKRSIAEVCLLLAALAPLATYLVSPVCSAALDGADALGAREQIVSFDSDITVRKNATLLVRETIRVRSLGEAIRHGIYREFVAQNGEPAMRFRVSEAQLDGKPVPFREEENNGNRRIYLGAAESALSPGEHEFSLLYETEPVISERDGRDRLYWNVTGNHWEFPIRWAKATVHLPEGIPQDALNPEGFTGPHGAAGKNYLFDLDTPGAVTFTAGMLARHEGLTISVDWPRGFIHRGWGIPLFFLNDAGLSVALAFLVLLLVYWSISWSWFGKDPAGGTIAARNNPPQALSPAGARYLRQMWLDNKTFTTAIVSMASAGVLQVEDNGEDFVLRRTRSDFHSLAPEERALARALFGASETVSLRMEARRVRKALAAFSKALKDRYGKYFSGNSQFAAPAWVITALAVAWSWYLVVRWKREDVLPSLILLICIAGCIILLRHFWPTSLKEWKNPAVSAKSSAPIEVERRNFWLVLGLVVVLGVLAFALAQSTSIVWTSILAAFVTMNFVFTRLMKSPTPEGQRLLDELEGFRRHLIQLRFENEEPVGAHRAAFERCMGYAMALDIEVQWARRFYKALEQAAEQGGSYAPDWYVGLSFHRFFLRPSLGNAAAAASLAAYTNSHSGGGSSVLSGGGGSGSGGSGGGGGFSGGGAGAGGGGGW